MITRALVLTALLVAAPAMAQTTSQSPATTPSSGGQGDTHVSTTPSQDPTLGTGQVQKRAAKSHAAKPRHARAATAGNGQP